MKTGRVGYDLRNKFIQHILREARPGLDNAQQRILATAAQAGDQGAADKLIRSCYRLLLQMSIRAAGAHVRAELEDIFSAACRGFLIALQRYDHRPTCELLSYAAFWVRASINKCCYTAGFNVARPERHTTVIPEYTTGLSVEPADAPKRVENGTLLYDEPGGNPANWREVGGNAVAHLVSKQPLPDAIVDKLGAKQQCLSLLKTTTLTEREKRFFNAYFGLDGEPGGRTYEQVGATFGVTRQRAEQIVKRVIIRLRAAA